ncbi:MAG: hypothetical protein IJF29_06455 [Firmicutes bacterium]|nr:hypothetical protein [Bacillota bacterium]
MLIDGAFELADRGEIELKSGKDIQDVANDEVEGYNVSKVGTYDSTIEWSLFNISVRAEGNGFWGTRVKQHDPRVDAYELKINPNNESYYLLNSEGKYVQFENMANGVVQDTKLIEDSKSYYHVWDMPPFARAGVITQAERQLDAAGLAGYKVEWLISDKKAVEQLTELFEMENIDIKVTYFPE